MAKTNTAGPTPDAEGAPVPETLPPPPLEETRTIEEWREVRKPEAWVHEAAKSLRHWPNGKVLAADEYDSACLAAQQIEVS